MLGRKKDYNQNLEKNTIRKINVQRLRCENRETQEKKSKNENLILQAWNETFAFWNSSFDARRIANMQLIRVPELEG